MIRSKVFTNNYIRTNSILKSPQIFQKRGVDDNHYLLIGYDAPRSEVLPVAVKHVQFLRTRVEHLILPETVRLGERGLYRMYPKVAHVGDM